MLKQLVKSPLVKIRESRTRQALLYGLILILVTGLTPRTFRQIGNTADFWYTKLNWRQCADVVIAGDSRTYRGLSPHHMALEMPNRRILNFGFSGTGFSEDYLSAIEQVVDPQSPQQTIVLGITPGALTLAATDKNQFTELSSTNTLMNVVKARYLGRLVQYFEPLGIDSVRLPFSGRKQNSDEYHPKGWVASYHTPHTSDRLILYYRDFFASTKVNERIVDGVLDRVSQWSAQGIHVYGFRPPTTEKMCAVENELSGFDEQRFCNRFQRAGGIWLPLDNQGWQSYDGSHIDHESAIRLSYHLANRIGRAEALSVVRRTDVLR